LRVEAVGRTVRRTIIQFELGPNLGLIVELRLMWDEATDNGAELRKFVASLQTALAE
jgi:hypothetical protein